jgi:hypothetical protein
MRDSHIYKPAAIRYYFGQLVIGFAEFLKWLVCSW